MPESPFPRHTTGLHHTALRATDFERTLKFYCEGLGFTKKVAWSMGKDGATKAVMLDAGDGNYLEVFSNGNPEDPAEARYAHIALRTDNIESAHAAALAAGAKERVAPTDFNIEDTLSGTPHTGKLSFVLGPDDEVIEFMQTQML
ncbi:MAG: VOC family protein [Opitutales bacterium]